MMLNDTVSRLSEAVGENDHLIDAANQKVMELTRSTDKLVNRNKQLKQHRDLLRKILAATLVALLVVLN